MALEAFTMFEHRTMFPTASDPDVVRARARRNVGGRGIGRRHVSGSHRRGPSESDTDRDARGGEQRTSRQNQSSEQLAFHIVSFLTPYQMHDEIQSKTIENTESVQRKRWLKATRLVVE